MQVSLIHIDRLLESICQTILSKDNYEDLCGDLLTIRLIMQNEFAVGPTIKKHLAECLKAILTRFSCEFKALDGKGQFVFFFFYFAYVKNNFWFIP